jgi:ABC-2 type transport system ATP-binding protein
VTIIDKGRIVAVDTPDQLRRRMTGASIVRVQLRGEPSAIEASLKQLPGVARAEVVGDTEGFTCFDVETNAGADVREAIFRLAVERRWSLRELAQTQASLEDVFIHLTTHEQTG